MADISVVKGFRRITHPSKMVVPIPIPIPMQDAIYLPHRISPPSSSPENWCTKRCTDTKLWWPRNWCVLLETFEYSKILLQIEIHANLKVLKYFFVRYVHALTLADSHLLISAKNGKKYHMSDGKIYSLVKQIIKPFFSVERRGSICEIGRINHFIDKFLKTLVGIFSFQNVFVSL